MTTCDAFDDRLSDYLDGELSETDRTAVEEHLAACASCRTTLSELRRVVTHAAALTDSAPGTDLWPAIARRIDTDAAPVVPFQTKTRRKFSVTFSFTLPQLAAAVLAVMVLSAGMIWIARLGGDRTDFPPVGARAQQEPADVAGSDAAVQIRPANFADVAYDEAIADLQQTLAAGRTRLDADTIRVLEENLKAIDRAIDQCRRALENDPANVYLNTHLAEAKKRKLALLRRASALAHQEG